MYQIIHLSDWVLRVSDGAMIPPDPKNRDYQDLLAWIAAGNVIAPANIPMVDTNLSPSEQIILADGESEAKVLITGTPLAEIAFAINGVTQTETLDSSGQTTIELTCSTPGTTIVIVAGNSQAIIYAVEAP
jgi:hypothetical protein